MGQREIEYSGQFQKDVKRAQKRHKDVGKLKTLMTLLIHHPFPLPAIYKDHPLQGHIADTGMPILGLTGFLLIR